MATIKKSDLIGLPQEVTSEILRVKVSGRNGEYTLKQFLENNCIKVDGGDGYSGVFATKSYEFFHLMPENRDINPALVKQLVNSYRDNGYKFPIVKVNESLGIIDAQHRFKAAEKSTFPIYFRIFPGWNINDIITLNVNQMNWGDNDYLKSFLTRYRSGETEYEGYFFFNKLLKKFDYLSISTALEISIRDFQGTQRKNFRNGELIFTEDQLKGAVGRAKKILELSQYHPKGATRKNFVRACLFMMRQVGYDHQTMLDKLRAYPDESKILRESATMEIVSYLEIFTNVYDFKKHKGNRINLDLKWREKK